MTRQYVLTWGGYPHLIVEFGWIWGVDPGSRVRVESSRIIFLWTCHICTVGAQHVWMGVRWCVHASSSRGQIEKTAAGAGPPWWTQAFILQGLLKLWALSALSARRWISISGGGEGGGDAGSVEGGRGVWVQRGLGKGAAAPGGGWGGVRWTQGVTGWPIQQLEVAEETRRAEHLTDLRKQDWMSWAQYLGGRIWRWICEGGGTDPSCVCRWMVLGCGSGWRRRNAGWRGLSPGWRRRPPHLLLEAAGLARRRNWPEGQNWAELETPSGTALMNPPCWQKEN